MLVVLMVPHHLKHFLQHAIPSIEHIHSRVQLQVLPHALVQDLQAIWCTPEELWNIKHNTKQVDCRPLQKDLANEPCHLLPADVNSAMLSKRLGQILGDLNNVLQPLLVTAQQS
eukprot:GHRR01027559.1.p3 GENE.GHRR01027559.1~~GHRR01027559.1.p3  ORF type:complete len:114 (-),score=10.80 GHRR01027559.1:791-1132(-)